MEWCQFKRITIYFESTRQYKNYTFLKIVTNVITGQKNQFDWCRYTLGYCQGLLKGGGGGDAERMTSLRYGNCEGLAFDKALTLSQVAIASDVACWL